MFDNYGLFTEVMAMASHVKQDYAAISAAHRTILREIERIPGRKKHKPTNIEIQCPFHPGDNTPSCGIYIGTGGTLPLGWFYCLGCGAKGPWNKLAEKLKLQTIARSDTKRDSASVSSTEMDRARLKCMGADKTGVDQYASVMRLGMPKPFDRPQWRGISGALMRDLGAQIAVDTTSKRLREVLLLPLTLYGELVTVIKAAMYKVKGDLSYVVYDEADTKTKGLFGFDLVVDMLNKGKYQWVVLVEGQRDALRLIQYGIPAIAILGTQSWTAEKRDLLVGLGTGVAVMMDGDPAGVAAARKIMPDLRRLTEVREIDLMPLTEEFGQKVDPGNMPIWKIKELQALNVSSRKLRGRRVPRYSRRQERVDKQTRQGQVNRYQVELEQSE
ncbi:DNA primase [Pseudomonas phage vB_PpuM-Pori-4]